VTPPRTAQLLKIARKPESGWKANGVTFPDRRNFTSSTSFCFSPNTPEEEEEQLCMAKQLSLGSIPFDNGDNTEQTTEAANILLFLKFSKE
jgi:hypothetical protein